MLDRVLCCCSIECPSPTPTSPSFTIGGGGHMAVHSRMALIHTHLPVFYYWGGGGGTWLSIVEWPSSTPTSPSFTMGGGGHGWRGGVLHAPHTLMLPRRRGWHVAAFVSVHIPSRRHSVLSPLGSLKQVFAGMVQVHGDAFQQYFWFLPRIGIVQSVLMLDSYVHVLCLSGVALCVLACVRVWARVCVQWSSHAFTHYRYRSGNLILKTNKINTRTHMRHTHTRAHARTRVRTHTIYTRHTRTHVRTQSRKYSRCRSTSDVVYVTSKTCCMSGLSHGPWPRLFLPTSLLCLPARVRVFFFSIKTTEWRLLSAFAWQALFFRCLATLSF